MDQAMIFCRYKTRPPPPSRFDLPTTVRRKTSWDGFITLSEPRKLAADIHGKHDIESAVDRCCSGCVQGWSSLGVTASLSRAQLVERDRFARFGSLSCAPPMRSKRGTTGCNVSGHAIHNAFEKLPKVPPQLYVAFDLTKSRGEIGPMPSYLFVRVDVAQ